MAEANYPAQYESEVASASVNVGDLVLFYSSDGSVSGVNETLVGGWSGYDGGYLKAFVIDEKGTANLSEAGDVVHTGKEDAISASVNSYHAGQGKGSYITFASLNKGDFFLEWDEDYHGNSADHWDYSGKYRRLDSGETYGVYHQTIQASSAGNLKKGTDYAVEHTAFKISLTIVPIPENLTAQGTNTNTIELGWESDRDPDNFSIERKRMMGRGDFEVIDTINGVNRTYTDQTVSSSVPYAYRVWGATPSPSDFTLDTTQKEVRLGDLVVTYENSSISGVSYSTIIHDLGSDAGRLKVFLIREDGTANINASGDPEIIHIGHEGIDRVGVEVKISSEDSSTGTFASLDSGDIIIQWDESSEGRDSGYYSFTGSERLLYTQQGDKAYRRVSQIFEPGDISRDQSTGVELATISLDVSRGSVLFDTQAGPTNEAEARTTMTSIDVR